MDNKERLRKWLWLGLDETTAKKYQRKISAENVRIVRNESVAIAGIGALYTICMLALSRVYGKSVICIIGAILMFCIFLYTQNLVKKQDEISKKEARISISSFMICAYVVSIYVGTFGSGNELAVTIVSLFVFLPTNFDLLPIYNLYVTIIALAVFFVSSYISKTNLLMM